MIELKFDVNNDGTRNDFFRNILPRAVESLDKEKKPAWGRMSAQHVVEHLIFTFRISTGKIIVDCKTSEPLLNRVKKFLYTDQETPRNFKNPLLGDSPPELQYSDLENAKKAFSVELDYFIEHYNLNPDALHTHPIFGSIGKDAWERALYKHSYHHLLQFGIVKEPAEIIHQGSYHNPPNR